ncbi:cation-transporting P-type ATPase, partial [Lentzea sp.]|uniref:P-type ATPase n=1 Tax=Lentzea sp. TaxID=56099 RepID=UPI002ED53F6E
MPVTTAEREDVAHHGLPVPEVVVLAETDQDTGLTTAQWRRRIADLGPNELPQRRGQSWVVRLVLQLHHPLIYVLLAAASITAVLGEVVDASVVFGVVVVNAIIGFVQEARAEKALDALVAMVRTEVTVVRDGVPVRVPSAELVPGDVVLLDAGDQVGADVRLVGARELRVDESALTGESAPSAKNPLVLPPDTALANRANMAFSGTLVTSGSGRGIVVATGAETEIGRVHRLVNTTTSVQTPLTRKLAHFSQVLTVVILGLAAFSVVVGVLRGEPVAEMVTAAVAL